MFKSLKFYIKYLKFYFKNRIKGNHKVPIYVNPLISGCLYLNLNPKLKLTNKSEEIKFELKMSDFKHYYEFFDYFKLEKFY